MVGAAIVVPSTALAVAFPVLLLTAGSQSSPDRSKADADLMRKKLATISADLGLAWLSAALRPSAPPPATWPASARASTPPLRS